jgi:hypothetical protein
VHCHPIRALKIVNKSAQRGFEPEVIEHTWVKAVTKMANLV